MSADFSEHATSAAAELKPRNPRTAVTGKECNLVGNRLPVLQAIIECGLLTKEQICRFTGIPDRPVYDAVEALQDGGLVRSLKDFSELLDRPEVRSGRDVGLAHGRTGQSVQRKHGNGHE